MHTRLRYPLLAWCLLILSVLFTTGWAQADTLPRVERFSVRQVESLAPGTELWFEVRGSAGAQAQVTIDGARRPLGLEETRRGQYEGSYTISTRDRIRFDSPVKVSLTLGGQSLQVPLQQPLLAASAYRDAVRASAPVPVIESFDTRAEAWGPGQEILFQLRGTPGAQIRMEVQGTDARITLSEESPGLYTGYYTIRARDRITERSLVRVSLLQGQQSAQADKLLGAPVLRPAQALRHACEVCGVVEAVNLVEVQGDPGYGGAVVGGLAGAVLGNQVGKGDGRTVARVLGAVGGAYAGRELSKNQAKVQQYDVVVRLHNGSTQTVRHEQDPGLHPGDQVRLVDGRAVANP